MDPRFVTKDLHALVDYPVALMLMTAPFLLALGDSHPAALWLAVATGVAALFLTIFTNHKLGIIRVLPYKLHVAVDALVGITFLTAPFMFSFSGLDAWFYWLNGATVMFVVSMSKPEATNHTQPQPTLA